MKRNYIYLLTLLCVAIFLSCEREAPSLIDEVEISFGMPEKFGDIEVLPEKRVYANKEVRLKSSTTEYVAMTDANGKAVFKNVFPDIYNISTAWELSEKEYNELTGKDVQLELGSKPLLSGNKPNIQLFEGKSLNEEITFAFIKSLMISKIYYSMSKNNNNKNYMDDSYIEIYNNSSEPVSLDNLHVGLTEAMSKPAFLAQDNPNYVYLQQVVRIPNGYELGGYESLLIACRKALDHTVNAPNSVNLENADFEVKNYDGDNNPNIKALPVLYNSTGGLTFLNIPNTGNSAVLFKTEEDITKWEALPPPDRPTNAQKFLKVDNHIIIDGVEILNYKTTGVDPQLKRLNNSIDATYTHITGGSYSNEACERRVESVIEVDGKKYYKLMDTNNSLKDFALTKSDIRPRVYDKPELLTNH